MSDESVARVKCSPDEFVFSTYAGESELPELTKLIDASLSEPYSVFTYRFFVSQWPELTFVVRHNSQVIAVAMSKLEPDTGDASLQAGYIGMLAVDPRYRGYRLGQTLVRLTLAAMKRAGADLAVLEAEASNLVALKLYEQLGFVRVAQLNSYYLNNSDAFRLQFWFNHLPGLLAPEDTVPPPAGSAAAAEKGVDKKAAASAPAAAAT